MHWFGVAILLITLLHNYAYATETTSLCDTMIDMADDTNNMLISYTIDPDRGYLAFALNGTRRTNSLLSVRVYSAFGGPKIGIYAMYDPKCPSPPMYPGYSACCGRVVENQLKTNNDYNIIVQPDKKQENPVRLQLLVCSDAEACPAVCPRDCSGNGWCNTTSKACLCDEGYIGEDCAACPGCNYIPSHTEPHVYLGIFTTVGMAVLVVGIIPIIACIAIISTIVFLKRQANEQRYLKLPVHAMFRNKLDDDYDDENPPTVGIVDSVPPQISPPGLRTSNGGLRTSNGGLRTSTGGLRTSTGGLRTSGGLRNSGGIERSALYKSGGITPANDRPVLYRSGDNSVMYSPSLTMQPRKYTAVPLPGQNGTQIFQLDEDN